MQADAEGPRFAAYGFVTLTDPGASVEDAVSDYREAGSGLVEFASPVVGGPYEAFVAVKADSFAAIRDFVTAGGRRPGVRVDWSMLVRPGALGAPHRRFEESLTTRFESLTRVRTRPGRVRAVLAEIDAAYGGKRSGEFDARAAIVTGRDVDILVELAATSLEALQESIVNDLAIIDGIDSSDTVFAHVEG